MASSEAVELQVAIETEFLAEQLTSTSLRELTDSELALVSGGADVVSK